MFQALFDKFKSKNTASADIDRPPLILPDMVIQEDFLPDPYGDCFCGSQQIFIKCCGSTKENRKPPYGLHVVDNYFAPEAIQEWRELADQCHGERLKVIHQSSTVDNLKLVEDERRISELVDLGEHQQRINRIIGELYTQLARDLYQSELDWFERPQLLRYRPGGLYVRHADSQNLDMETKTWSKTIDRDLSLLIYLNDDFEGGELLFSKFNYRLRPKAGMVVMFPSDHRYLHEAETVVEGIRYAFVSWASVSGVNKVRENPPASAILIE